VHVVDFFQSMVGKQEVGLSQFFHNELVIEPMGLGPMEVAAQFVHYFVSILHSVLIQYTLLQGMGIRFMSMGVESGIQLIMSEKER